MVAHGWDQGEYLYMLTREQERENIFKTVEAITRLRASVQPDGRHRESGPRITRWS
jgi:hypothetical protein